MLINSPNHLIKLESSVKNLKCSLVTWWRGIWGLPQTLTLKETKELDEKDEDTGFLRQKRLAKPSTCQLTKKNGERKKRK